MIQNVEFDVWHLNILFSWNEPEKVYCHMASVMVRKKRESLVRRSAIQNSIYSDSSLANKIIFSDDSAFSSFASSSSVSLDFRRVLPWLVLRRRHWGVVLDSSPWFPPTCRPDICGNFEEIFWLLHLSPSFTVLFNGVWNYLSVYALHRSSSVYFYLAGLDTINSQIQIWLLSFFHDYRQKQWKKIYISVKTLFHSLNENSSRDEKLKVFKDIYYRVGQKTSRFQNVAISS